VQLELLDQCCDLPDAGRTCRLQWKGSIYVTGTQYDIVPSYTTHLSQSPAALPDAAGHNMHMQESADAACLLCIPGAVNCLHAVESDMCSGFTLAHSAPQTCNNQQRSKPLLALDTCKPPLALLYRQPAASTHGLMQTSATTSTTEHKRFPLRAALLAAPALQAGLSYPQRPAASPPLCSSHAWCP
jgi:hypothetical protein